MFKEIEGGDCIDVYGLKCWRPPMPPEHEIKGSHLPKAEQKWERTALPEFELDDIEVWSNTEYNPGEKLSWDTCRREEVIKQTGRDPWNINNRGQMIAVDGVVADPTYKSEPLFRFRKRELDRCDPWTGGFWFMNNGRPTWLTPFHYFYLCWWKLPSGYPFYYLVDEEAFYFWQYCFTDPECYGMLEVRKRGCGKSFRVAAITYLRTIYEAKRYSGIQSKNDDDAESFFLKKLVVPYKELPHFFVPTNTHGTDPKTALIFNADPSRGKDSAFLRKNQQNALGCTLDFRNASENAYDSQDITGVLVQDEVGKTPPAVADVYARHNVNKNCVYRDGRLFGKIYATTTVEKMEKGGESFKKMWDASDPETIDEETNQTSSGLYRFFIPAWKDEYKDEYGMPDTVKGRSRQGANRRKYKSTDPQAYTQYCLQYPWDEYDIFKAMDSMCIFNMEVLQENERRFNEKGETYQVKVGNFELRTNEDGSLYSEWVDDEEKGRWHVSYFWPRTDLANNFDKFSTYDGNFRYTPLNSHLIKFGYDPSKGGRNLDNRSSKDAIVGVMTAGGDPEYAQTPIADYMFEPSSPEDAYKDLMAAMLYYGAPVLIENNVRDPINYLNRNGFEDFIVLRPFNTMTNPNMTQNEGMPSSPATIDIQEKRGQSWVTIHGRRQRHYRINKQMMEYNGMNRTKLDLAVAKLVALVAADDEVPGRQEATSIDNIIRTFDNSGMYSKLRLN